MKHQVRSTVVALVAVAMVITLGNPAHAEDTQSLTTSDVRAVAPEPADHEALSEVPLTSDESLDPSTPESLDPSTPESLDPLIAESLDPSMTKMSRGVPMAASPARCSGMTTFANRVGSDSLVYGRTKCSRSVEAVGVTTYLWNAQWWGWNLLRTTSSSRRFSDFSGDAVSRYPCSTRDKNWFFGSSDHYSVERGRTYRGSSRSPERQFGC